MHLGRVQGGDGGPGENLDLIPRRARVQVPSQAARQAAVDERGVDRGNCRLE